MIALLVLIIAVVHPSLGDLWDEKDDCTLAIRQRNPNRTAFDKFVGLMNKLTDPAKLKEDSYYEEDCSGTLKTFKGCQTFSCKDSNGNDLFVFNDCAPGEHKCTLQLYKICFRLSGTSNCTTCSTEHCNKKKLELKTPNLGTKVEETSTDGTAGDKSLSASPDFRLHFGAKLPPSNGAGGATLYSSTTSLLLFAFLLLCTQK